MPYESESGDLDLALVGEVLLTRTIRPYREPAFLELLDVLRRADVTFANAETLFHDYEGVPREESKGTYMRCSPEVAGDLAWLGVGLVSTANNHAYDYTDRGVMANRAALARHGIAAAGTGPTMGLARAPAFLETRAGRVGLVAATDHINTQAGRASDPRADAPGRPGANVLRVQTTYTLPTSLFEDLRRVDQELGFDRARERVRRGRFPTDRYTEEPDELYFGPTLEPGPSLFRRGDAISRTTTIDQADWEATRRTIQQARAMADWVIFSFHCGYNGSTPDDPPAHWTRMAHDAVDDGVDVVVGHGPHRDKGIELYNGRPIFYSLGNFILQNDTVEVQPADAYARLGLACSSLPHDFYRERSSGSESGQDTRPENWESFVPVISWRGRRVRSIELHPVHLAREASPAARGRPLLAQGPQADAILERLQRCSAPFSTHITKRDGRGHVVVD